MLKGGKARGDERNISGHASRILLHLLKGNSDFLSWKYFAIAAKINLKYKVVLLKHECSINGKLDFHELHMFTGAGSIFDTRPSCHIILPQCFLISAIFQEAIFPPSFP